MDKVKLVPNLIPTVEDFRALQDSPINFAGQVFSAMMDADSYLQNKLPSELGTLNYGILDPDTMFIVSLNESNQTRIDVKNTDTRNGILYTRILERGYLTTDQYALALSDYTAGIRNYVCAKVTVNSSGPQGVTTDGTLENKRYTNSVSIMVYSQDEFDALSSSDLDTIVCLCVIISNGPGVNLTTTSLDITQDYYLENRPQFSARAHYHEKKLGSGIVTKRNIHGLALSDLMSGGISAFPNVFLENRKGVYYGDYVTESIVTYAQDITGEITGFTNNWYCTLTHFPKHIVYVTINSSEIFCNLIHGTKYIDLGSVEPASVPIVVRYLYYTIAESSANSNIINLLEPLTNEYFMVNGTFSNSFNNSSVSFADAPAYDLDFDVVLGEERNFFKKPLVLIPKARIIDSAVYDGLNISFEQSKIRLYPENFVTGNLSKIATYGKDVNGNDVLENFEITSNTIYESIQYFASIGKITIETSNVSPSAIVSIMSVRRADPSVELTVCTVHRASSGALTKLRDTRPFSGTITDPSTKTKISVKEKNTEDYFRRNDSMKYYFAENFFDTQYTDFIRSKVYPRNGMITNGFWVSTQIQTPENFDRIKINYEKLNNISPIIYYSVDNGDNWITIDEEDIDTIMQFDTGVSAIRFRIDTSNNSVVGSFVALFYKQYDVEFDSEDSEIRSF